MNNFIGCIFSVMTLLCACTQRTTTSNLDVSVRDSVLIYKIQGLKEFIKEADYWGDDIESYWAFKQADSILNTITDYGKYEESLARIYAATSYVSYGLSYVASVMEECRQMAEGNDDSFPKTGIEEAQKKIIRDYTIPNDYILFNTTRLEFRALYSLLYFFKANRFAEFENRLLPNYDRSMMYKTIYADMPPKVAYRISSVLNMKSWFNYLIILAQQAYMENHGGRPDLDSMPWKEFIELAMWHDSLTNDNDESYYENMTDNEFHKIECKAAYTQYIIYKYISENLRGLKAKENHP